MSNCFASSLCVTYSRYIFSNTESALLALDPGYTVDKTNVVAVLTLEQAQPPKRLSKHRDELSNRTSSRRRITGFKNAGHAPKVRRIGKSCSPHAFGHEGGSDTESDGKSDESEDVPMLISNWNPAPSSESIFEDGFDDSTFAESGKVLPYFLR